MNKYTELSDFEINKKVADLIGGTPFPFGTTEYRRSAVSGCESSIIIRSPRKVGSFDACNNPADAMPIIIENKIGMNFIGNIVGWSASHICESKGELEVYDKNYYRAAMMCFLIMKDAENEKV
ncbi:TPA: DUF2591 family protein [Proteus mirabilis]